MKERLSRLPLRVKIEIVALILLFSSVAVGAIAPEIMAYKPAIFNSNLTVTGTTTMTGAATFAGDMDLNGSFDQDGATCTIDTTGVFSIDGVGASNVTADTGSLTLATTTSGTLGLSSVALVDLDAGANLDVDVTGSIAMDASTTVATTSAGAQYINSATGDVTLDYRDYADTTDDDMAHAIVTVNCTDASTGAEDCDYSIGVVEGGAAAETRFSIDGDGGMAYGSANTDSHTFSADGATDADFVVPNTSIGAAELVNRAVSSVKFAGLTNTYRFCGQGVNGSGPNWLGPVPIGSNGADYTTGAAGCDALDSTTEATADAPVDAFAYTVIGMVCSVTDGGTDDTYTFQARDDTADVTGATCAVTLNGAGTETCSVSGIAVAVAAGSAVAVSQIATDDDCSACDAECLVFVTY